MKFKFKKIASILAGTVLMSSTIAFAAAANYPSPFVQSGSADVAVVYGSMPGAEFDLLAVSDITASLQAKLAAQTATGSTGSSGTSVSGGDSVKLSKPSNSLNINETADAAFGSTTVTYTDLPVLLAKGTYTNDANNDYKYEQKLTIGTTLRLNGFSDSEHNDRTPSVGINVSSDTAVLNYTLQFTTAAESAVSSANRLTDFETTNLNILGKSYYVLKADNATNNWKFTLLDAASSAIVKEGETKTATVGAKNYEIAIDFISTSEVRLRVNGEVTKALAELETYKLSDGTYIGIKDIAARDVAGALGSVELSIGTGKLELTNGQAVVLNDKSISQVLSYITPATSSGSTRKLQSITLEWKTDDKEFITPDTELVMPGFGAVKLAMGKFYQPAQEVTEVANGGSDYMQIETTIRDGDVTIPILYANASGEFAGIGRDANNRLTTSPGSNILYNYTGGDRYMVASWNSTTDSESYYLKFSTPTNDNGINRTTISRWVNGAWVDDTDKTIGDTVTYGSMTLTITNVSRTGDKSVNITGGTGVSFNTLYTASGLRISLPYPDTNTSIAHGAVNLTYASAPLISTGTAGHNSDSFFLIFKEEDKNNNVAAGRLINVTLNDQSDGDVEVSDYDAGSQQISDPADSNHKISWTLSDLATKVERMGDSSAQKTAKLTYSAGESYAELFLSAPGATVSSSNSTTVGSSTVRELGSVSFTDANVPTGKNLIVVGGSCVNGIAAQLLGVSAGTCGAAWEQATGVGAGSFLIQSFDRSGKVATLVAGYNAEDTRNAAKVLTTSAVDTMSGKKYKSTSATAVQLDTTTTSGNSS